MNMSEQIKQQLESAQRVQKALAPRSGSLPNIDVPVDTTPACYVGGDICDVFETDRGRTALVIGDVCGKGVAAGLLMGLIYGAVRSSSWTASKRDHEDASERLNDLLRRKTSPDRFVTLFSTYYEPETSTLRYINAGHLPMLLVRKNDDNEFHVERLEKGGPVLGILEWGDYQQGELRIQEGDLLVMFSDGVYEPVNADEQQFGDGRLLEVIRECYNGSATEIRDAILAAFRDHNCEDARPADDQTLVVARFQNVNAGGVLPSISQFFTGVDR